MGGEGEAGILQLSGSYMHTYTQQGNPEGGEGVQPGNNSPFSITLELIPPLGYFTFLLHFQLTLDL